MRAIIILVFMVLVGFDTSAQNVVVPDANFMAYFLGNPLINTNNDDEIQMSEAGVFTGGIGCNHLSIEDLTGIEAFPLLSALSCYNNLLTRLDVTANVSLASLLCDENQIEQLDLSNNKKLTDV